MAPVTDSIADIWEESTPHKPVLFLLAPGSDPTSTIDELLSNQTNFGYMKVLGHRFSIGEHKLNLLEVL